MVGSHALLLRLFQSQSYFSVHLALQYLSTYYDHIGITHYITGRLRELEDSELDDVWGFICHLLVTRPSKSCALETFVIERAEQSTHSALLTLWFMQTYLTDLSTTRRNTPSFTICQRVLLKTQNIIFSDPSTTSTIPYPSLRNTSPATPTPRFWKRRIKPRIGPAIIGMSTILAGAPGLPQVAETTGRVAIEQGRMGDGDGRPKPFHTAADDDELAGLSASTSTLPTRQDEADNDLEPDSDDNDLEAGFEDSDEEQDVDTFGQTTMSKLTIPLSPSLNKTSKTAPSSPLTAPPVQRRSTSGGENSPDGRGTPGSSSLSRRTTIGPSRTTPSLVRRKARSAVFAQTNSPSHSTPSLHIARGSSASTRDSQDDPLVLLDPTIQTQLLRAHYCRSEVQFVLQLESIANRLLVVPKPARVSALRAELTAMNHRLPAEVDIPMWTSDADATQRPKSKDGVKGHNRIVRIPPGESVVLNSAERAPYLLMVEILVGDLDFTPAKRANRDILKRLSVAQQDSEAKRRQSELDGIVPRPSAAALTRSSKTSETTPPIPMISTSLDGSPTLEEELEEGIGSVSMSATSSVQSPVDQDEEEIDLVEQLYGPDVSIRAEKVDLSDSIVLPAAPKNKALDIATWSKGSPSLSRANSPLQTPKIGAEPNSPSRLSPAGTPDPQPSPRRHHAPLSLEDYSERMRTAAIMLAQLNANLVREPVTTINAPSTSVSPSTSPNAPSLDAVPGTPGTSDASKQSAFKWMPGSGWITGSGSHSRNNSADQTPPPPPPAMRMRLQHAEATAIRDKIMQEMMALEEERLERMKAPVDGEVGLGSIGERSKSAQAAEDENIVRRELNKADPSAAVFRESWVAKKSRIRAASPYGHLASWDCLSVIVKTGADLRQEQLAVQLIQIFDQIWKSENCGVWVKHFRILITGSKSGLVETITDTVSIHSIKKAEYARRLAEGRFGHVTLMDHFVNTYGDPSSAKFARAQRCFAKSLAGYSLITYFLQVKDRHNGNILIDREGHIVHIDFGFMLSNSPGNVGLEASPFKFPFEYLEVLGGMEGEAFLDFKRLFREGFEVARKHCDSIVAIVELMQKDSTLPCFAALGEQTAQVLRDRFQQALPTSAIGDHVERLIMSSIGSNWTRLYDSFQYYSQSIL